MVPTVMHVSAIVHPLLFGDLPSGCCALCFLYIAYDTTNLDYMIIAGANRRSGEPVQAERNSAVANSGSLFLA